MQLNERDDVQCKYKVIYIYIYVGYLFFYHVILFLSCTYFQQTHGTQVFTSVLTTELYVFGPLARGFQHLKC